MTIDEHKIPLDELVQRFETSVEEGHSTQKARELLEKNGPNALTPPAETPEWVKFCKLLFGGFSALLWVSRWTGEMVRWPLYHRTVHCLGCCYSLSDCLRSPSRFRSHNAKRQFMVGYRLARRRGDYCHICLLSRIQGRQDYGILQENGISLTRIC